MIRTPLRLCVLALAIAACGDAVVGPNPEAPKIIPARLQLDSQLITLPIGRDTTLKVAAYDMFGVLVTAPSVAWSSSAPGVAQVSDGGVVRGMIAGRATIKAAWEGVIAQVDVQVQLAPASERLSLSSSPNFGGPILLAVDEGPLAVVQTHVLGTNNHERFDYQAVWKSADTSIARFEYADGQKAYVKGVGRGITKVSATVGDMVAVMIVEVFGVAPGEPLLDVKEAYMAEYQYGSLPGFWFYAPIIRVAARNEPVEIVRLREVFPGVGPAPDVCTSLAVPSSGIDLNWEVYGDYALSYDAGNGARAAAGSEFLITIDFHNARGEPMSLPLHLPVKPAQLPTTYSGGNGRFWSSCWKH